MSDFDPSLIQDFLTEAGELIEQLDVDLVKLESAQDDDLSELCNACFRALHTIKGAASFLGLTAVTTFAHAAEDALNKMRKGEITITPEVMDAMLRSADVVRDQIESISNGEEAPEGPPELIQTLHQLAGGAPDNTEANASDDASPEPEADDDALPGTALSLPAQKLDLLDFMVQDLKDYAAELNDVLSQLDNDATREEAADQLAEIGDNLVKTAEFFELDDLSKVVALLVSVAPTLNDCPADVLPEMTIRLRAAQRMICDQGQALENHRVLAWSLDTFIQRVTRLSEHTQVESQFVGLHDGNVDNVLILDEIIKDQYVPQEDQASTPDEAQSPAQPSSPDTPQATTQTPVAADKKEDAANNKPVVEQTIRVEVGRLESLLNLVGQLVLNKNRVLGLTRNLKDTVAASELTEQFTAAASDLDHLMGELQVGVMRTRMQPLAKLFDRYPRVIRDIARSTDKKIDLVMEGKDTEVDKSVLENLADPLVHILRNSADHGVENPEDRLGKGKSETGVIRLVAEHQGSHVRVAIIDDGKGLDPKVIGAKALERGLVSADQLEKMPDKDIFRFIFEAGFSTAKQVSDLSGRGVGMDVVRTNVQKLNGTINIDSAVDKGTTIEILIPLTVAIMPAMVVGVGKHFYSIPLQSIVEIVRPEAEQVHTVKGQKVIRLRESVLPLINMQQRLNEVKNDDASRFAVVIAIGGQSVGLLVDKLVGQQEIVIKPLDDNYTQGGPFSGATIQDNGEISLILDVTQLVRDAPSDSDLNTQAA